MASSPPPPPPPHVPLLLLGDVGGTSTRLRLIDAYAKALPAPSTDVASARFRTASFPSLEDLLAAFCDSLAPAVRSAVVLCSLGVCGPVTAGAAAGAVHSHDYDDRDDYGDDCDDYEYDDDQYDAFNSSSSFFLPSSFGLDDGGGATAVLTAPTLGPAPWLVSEAALSERCGFPVRLLNDFEAVAEALPHLDHAKVREAVR